MLDDRAVQTDRLQVLLQLSRLGSMRAVADELGSTTSTVSQQVAALAREAGAPLVEPDGRRVRLTPAGRRLADHAVTILAAVDAALLDLRPGARPHGTVRVAGFATAVRRSLLPAVVHLRETQPDLRLVVLEHEPDEAYALLAADDIDLALTYDYVLAPWSPGPGLEARLLWTTPWGLGVPADSAERGGRARDVVGRHRHADWIVNSRSVADEAAVRALALAAGFEPRVRAPGRQPGAGRATGRRRDRRRTAARRRARPAGSAARAAARPRARAAGVRRDPSWAGRLAAGGRRAGPARLPGGSGIGERAQ